MDDYYSQIAPGYDALHGAEQDAKTRELLAKVELPQNATVLDVGCGTGRSSLLLPDAQWHGIEPSPGLIAYAAPDICGRIFAGRAEDLPFGEASFDAVLCVTVLQNVTDAHKALSEMRRVLKPNGVLLLSFLRKAQHRDSYEKIVRELFHVKATWEFAQDVCYVCERPSQLI